MLWYLLKGDIEIIESYKVGEDLRGSMVSAGVNSPIKNQGYLKKQEVSGSLVDTLMRWSPLWTRPYLPDHQQDD